MSSQWLQRIALGLVALGLLSAVAYRFIHASPPGSAGAAEAEPGAQAAAGPEATQPAPARLSLRPTITAEAAAWFSPVRALERLGSLQFTNNAQRASGTRTVIQQLENLAEAGPAAIPAIREFLRQGKNVTLSGRGDGLIPATLRIGLFEVLQRIGGPEAEAALAEALSGTRSGSEMRILAQMLETLSPGTYRDTVLASARRLAGAAEAGTDSARRDREAAYDVLGRAGDPSLVAQAQAGLLTASGRIDGAALRYLQRTLGNQSVGYFQQLLADPRLTHEDSRRELVRAIRDQASQSPDAALALREIASNANLGRRERDEAFDGLARLGDMSLAQVARERLVTDQGLINESALNYLARTTGDNFFADVLQAWGDPRVQSNREREELVQVITGRVGLSGDANHMWQEIAANPEMPLNLREEAIGELDDRGINTRRPTEQDRQLAAERLRLLEQLSPQLDDPRLQQRAARVRNELGQLVQGQPGRR